MFSAFAASGHPMPPRSRQPTPACNAVTVALPPVEDSVSRQAAIGVVIEPMAFDEPPAIPATWDDWNTVGPADDG
jgi:hypothetical protein